MTFILILLTAAFITGIGFLTISACGFLKDESLISRLSYSWGLGVGIIVWQMILYSTAGLGRWTATALVFPWIILGVIVVIIKRKIIKLPKMQFKNSPIELIIIFLLLLLIFFVGFESVLRPVPSWDGWSQWIFRSKIFYSYRYFTYQGFWYPQTDYPAVLPLLGTFGFIMMNGINDSYVLFLFFMFYLALGGVFYSVARKLFDRTPALILTFLLLSLQNLIRHGGFLEVGDTDLALGFYIFSSTWLLTKFFKTKSQSVLFLLSIFLCITAQIKNDGLPFVVFTLISIVAIIIRWKKYYYFIGLLPIVVFLFPWEIYKYVAHVPINQEFVSGIHIHWSKAFAIFFAMVKEFFNFQNWNILWAVFFATLLFCFRKLNQVKIFLLVFIVQWFSYYAIFMITPREPVGHVNNIIDRLYIQLAPLAVVITGIVLEEQIKKLKKSVNMKTLIKKVNASISRH